MTHADVHRRAAEVIARADALLVTAGAGMGVDSGLPDFRGTHGFWKAYPVYEKLGLDFAAMANPRWFAADPTFAWGFYGHRLSLYRATRPHAGFELLRSWARAMPHGVFVLTSNVDGQFQKAGFAEERVVEVHGSIHFLQCLGCGAGRPADSYVPVIDEPTLRAREPLPACPDCGALERPNILMFGDAEWDSSRTDAQERRLATWLRGIAPGKIAVVECGAGLAIPTVRRFSERVAAAGAELVRVNVRDPAVPAGGLALAEGALEALRAIDGELPRLS